MRGILNEEEGRGKSQSKESPRRLRPIRTKSRKMSNYESWQTSVHASDLSMVCISVLLVGTLSLAGPPRPPLKSSTQSLGAVSSQWLDDFMDDDVLREARWSAAAVPADDEQQYEGNDGALTYGEFSAESMHDMIGKAVALCGGDASDLTFVDLGSGAGRR